jgi:hypothetical protein
MSWLRSLTGLVDCLRHSRSSSVQPYCPSLQPLEDRLCLDAAALRAPVILPVPESSQQMLPVLGAGFDPGSVVLLNGRPLLTTFVNSTELLGFVRRVSAFARAHPRRFVRLYTLDDARPAFISVFTPGAGQSLPFHLTVREVHSGNPNDPLDPL